MLSIAKINDIKYLKQVQGLSYRKVNKYGFVDMIQINILLGLNFNYKKYGLK